VIDNLSRSNKNIIDGLIELTMFPENLIFKQVDLLNYDALNILFSTFLFDAVIHLASYISVSESISKPLEYYNNNVSGTINLLRVMDEFRCYNLIFSSSATVYGSAQVPYDENSPTGIGITSPYGRTKYFIEQILQDWSVSNPQCKIYILRYFNPIGIHPSGKLTHDFSRSNNLMPSIINAISNKDALYIFGCDYDTIDGTCVRDYIHVMDIIEGHLLALDNMLSAPATCEEDIREPTYQVFNLASGTKTSVLELCHEIERQGNLKINKIFTERRAGDLPEYYSLSDKANKILGWFPKRTLEDICRDILKNL
jgi:UDP-glucose 4-epimerase